ncbi:MAG: TDP-N-acetylfucosamine:lipid II N-acetylfucosaminyltransferase [Syntrophomonas sp.]
MIYHYIGQSPYTKKFISFMIENKNRFDLNRHFFIINDSNKSQWDEILFQCVQYIRIGSKWGFVSMLNKLTDQDKVIIHGLFNPRLIVYLYLNKKLVKRCAWSIWGGDVYFYRYKNSGIKNNVIEFLRKLVIPKIPFITALVKGDYEIIREVYNSKAKYIYSFYPNPVDFSLIENISFNNNDNGIKTIMVGNSGDPSNNHEEVIEMLKRFKEEDIRIICPLSYGNPDYIDKTIKKGIKTFGSKFVPLIEFIPPEEYVKILADVDVAIMNHNRQQGLGNIITLIALGKKVYVRYDTTSYKLFYDKGIHIFKTESIADASLNDLFNCRQINIEQNKSLIMNLFSNESACKSWSEVFYEI